MQYCDGRRQRRPFFRIWYAPRQPQMGLPGPRGRQIVVGVMAASLGLALAGQPDGRSGARAAFDAGLAALHNFEYEQANDAFRDARRLDPAFVLAYWGEAMTYYQTLWRNE